MTEYKCPRCGGEAGAHYAACVFTNMLQRWLGDDYPLFGPPTEAPDRPSMREMAAEVTYAATEPLRAQLAAMRHDLDSALDAITRPAPEPLSDEFVRATFDEDGPPEQEPEPETTELGRKLMADFLKPGSPPPASAPEHAEEVDWAELVRKIRNDHSWSQSRLAESLGVTRSLIGQWENGARPSIHNRARLRKLERGATVAPETRSKEELTASRLAAMKASNDTTAAKAGEVLERVIDERAVRDPDGWMNAQELLQLAEIADPSMTQRLVGLGMRALGYHEKRQILIDNGTRPTHYRGLAWKHSAIPESAPEPAAEPAPEPAAEPPLEEQMAARRAAEQEAQAQMPAEKPAKERYRYDGPRPGGELYQEYRELLEPLWSIPGWSYAPSNTNGGGKPRVTNPGGTSYVVPNTPSDWRAVKNTRAALRRLGAPL